MSAVWQNNDLIKKKGKSSQCLFYLAHISFDDNENKTFL
jgi:hypothetical protein